MTKRGMPSAAQMRLLNLLARFGVTPATTREVTLRACYLAGWITTADFPREITNLGRHALEAARASKGAEGWKT